MSKSPEKKGKSGRTQQQGQVPEEEHAHTSSFSMNLNIQDAALALFDNRGNLHGLLNSKPFLPYQKPALPLCRILPSAHYLLAHLKTSYLFLLLTSQCLSASLPKRYFHVTAEFECDMDFPVDQSEIAFQKWKAAYPNRPLLISGIGIMDSHRKTSRLNLDRSPALKDGSQPDYSRVFSYRFFEPLQIAIRSYNEIIQQWYDAGFTIIPANFVDVLSGVLPLPRDMRVAVFDI